MIPIAKQTDLTDCGVACVKSILNYNNIFVTLAELKSFNLFKVGFYSFQDIANLFGKYNLEATGYLTDLEALAKLDMPLIAHLKIKGLLTHFVVIHQVIDNKIYYMDPSAGKVVIMDEGRFMKMWTKRVLVIKESLSLKTQPIKSIQIDSSVAFLINRRTLIAITLGTTILVAIVRTALFN